MDKDFKDYINSKTPQCFHPPEVYYAQFALPIARWLVKCPICQTTVEEFETEAELDAVYSKIPKRKSVDKEGDVLLQLVLIEHATGDVTVQGEVGEITPRLDNVGYQIKAGHLQYKTCSFTEMREAINKAVSEQFGRKPEPPYIRNAYACFELVDEEGLTTELYQRQLSALNKIAGKDLPITDASESQVKSEWTKVFPPEHRFEGMSSDWHLGYVDCVYQLQKETAFTIWRLTVTR